MTSEALQEDNWTLVSVLNVLGLRRAALLRHSLDSRSSGADAAIVTERQFRTSDQVESENGPSSFIWTAPPLRRSAEGERESLNACIEKLNLKLPIRDGRRLPD